MSIFQREPAMVYSAIMAVVAEVILLVVAFGIDITPEQQAAVLGTVSAVLILVALLTTGVLVRGQVTPTSQVVERRVESTGRVVAGAGSELPTGTDIRGIGDIDYEPVWPAEWEQAGERFRDDNHDDRPDVAP